MTVVASCSRCGETCPAGARFCTRCGLHLAEGDPPAAAIPVIAAPPAIPAAPVPPAGPSISATPWTLPAPSIPSTPSAHAFPSPAGLPGPSAVGRRASRRGWLGVLVGALVFLVAAVGILVAADRVTIGPAVTGPIARWDRMLTNPSQIRNGEPFTVKVEAVNAAAAPTGRIWMVISWQPPGRAFTPGSAGSFVGCVPADCRFRDDATTATTVVYWPGIAADARNTYAVTVSVSGLTSGDTYHYAVSTGTGPDEHTLDGGYSWDLDAEVP